MDDHHYVESFRRQKKKLFFSPFTNYCLFVRVLTFFFSFQIQFQCQQHSFLSFFLYTIVVVYIFFCFLSFAKKISRQTKMYISLKLQRENVLCVCSFYASIFFSPSLRNVLDLFFLKNTLFDSFHFHLGFGFFFTKRKKN